MMIIRNWYSLAKLQISERKSKVIILKSNWMKGKLISRREEVCANRKWKAAKKSDLPKLSFVVSILFNHEYRIDRRLKRRFQINLRLAFLRTREEIFIKRPC